MSKKAFIKGLFLILMPMFIVLSFNQTNNKHYHLLECGQVIEHSHPYKSEKNPGTPFEKHSHTKTELIIISQISNLTGFLFLVLIFLAFFRKMFDRIFVKPAFIYSPSICLSTDKVRGPPSHTL